MNGSPHTPQLVSSPAANPASRTRGVKAEPSSLPTPPPDADGDLDHQHAILDEVDLFLSDDDEEDNPFHLFAQTQAPGLDTTIEVDQKYIAGDSGDGAADEEEAEEAAIRRHAEEMQHRADAGKEFRATQASGAGDDTNEELDDVKLDALFQRTVLGGYGSAPSTPRRRQPNGGGSVAATSRGTVSSGGTSGMDARRYQRNQRMMEQAGLGDLR